MNILFISLLDFSSVQQKNIYTDLLREFLSHGHRIYAVSPTDKAVTEPVIYEENVQIIKIELGNLQKTSNLIKKGISTLAFGHILIQKIKEHLGEIKFDLILYPTPPVTIYNAVKYVKKRDNASTYLMLKDIFPQGAVDLGALSVTGVRGAIYKYFRRQEKKLYQISDSIGCLSPANVKYLIKHDPEVDPQKIEVCPNSIEVIDKTLDVEERKQIRQKYDIPLHAKVFVYGGNLGRPQGIPFLIKCLEKVRNIEDAFFLIVGSGTEFETMKKSLEQIRSRNVKLIDYLPKDDYDRLVNSADVGMIFLDHRYTIPNFPSRLLTYMEAHIPVLAVTDPSTDIGSIIEDNQFGWWCESNDVTEFACKVKQCLASDLAESGERGYKYLLEHYTVGHAYQIIMNRMK